MEVDAVDAAASQCCGERCFVVKFKVRDVTRERVTREPFEKESVWRAVPRGEVQGARLARERERVFRSI